MEKLATEESGERSELGDEDREFIAKKRKFPANALGFLITPILWMIYFVAMYSVQGAGCAIDLDQVALLGTDALHLALGVLTVTFSAAIALIGLASFRAWRALLDELDDAEHPAHRHSTFLAYGALLHAGLFLVATLWSGIPIMLVDACDNLGST